MKAGFGPVMQSREGKDPESVNSVLFFLEKFWNNQKPMSHSWE